MAAVIMGIAVLAFAAYLWRCEYQMTKQSVGLTGTVVDVHPFGHTDDQHTFGPVVEYVHPESGATEQITIQRGSSAAPPAIGSTHDLLYVPSKAMIRCCSTDHSAKVLGVVGLVLITAGAVA